MDKIKIDRATLRKFGLTMAVCFTLITLVIFLRQRHSIFITSTISLCFLLFALAFPVSLKYFYIPWMKFAYILSWINTRLLLCLIFYLIFSPIGLVMRLFRIDLLERKFSSSRTSYWKPKEKNQFLPANYERRF